MADSTDETSQEPRSLDTEFTFAKGTQMHQAQSTGFLSVVRHKHCKTVSAAVGLLVIGLAFIIVSGVEFSKGESTRGLAFFIVGILCTIPGGNKEYIFLTERIPNILIVPYLEKNSRISIQSNSFL